MHELHNGQNPVPECRMGIIDPSNCPTQRPSPPSRATTRTWGICCWRCSLVTGRPSATFEHGSHSAGHQSVRSAKRTTKRSRNAWLLWVWFARVEGVVVPLDSQRALRAVVVSLEECRHLAWKYGWRSRPESSWCRPRPRGCAPVPVSPAASRWCHGRGSSPDLLPRKGCAVPPGTG